MRTLLEPLRRRKLKSASTRVKLNKKMIVLAISLWLLCTVVIVGDLVQNVKGFKDHIEKNHRVDITPLPYFKRMRQRLELTRGVAYMAITLLADAVVAYRCFVVWRPRLIIATLPWILWVALLSSCIGYVCSIVMIKYESSAERARITGWTTAFLSTSLATNFISTGLLAFKIWKIDRESSRFRLGDSLLKKLLRVAIDSGVIYTIALSATIAQFVGNASWTKVFVTMMPTIICITFYLMLIRIAHSVREQNEVPDVESVFNHDDAALRRITIRTSISVETGDSGSEIIMEKRELEHDPAGVEIPVVNRE
ncbi:hypothetical protein E1B28_005553 [Marasmius oreades]|nr:uncharacterized protein E1B28_005553 [Marasmius oreades]KAG7094735.1 hypothetical protein E1B28_005553 [Marasmius oreades]